MAPVAGVSAILVEQLINGTVVAKYLLKVFIKAQL